MIREAITVPVGGTKNIGWLEQVVFPGWRRTDYVLTETISQLSWPTYERKNGLILIEIYIYSKSYHRNSKIGKQRRFATNYVGAYFSI